MVPEGFVCHAEFVDFMAAQKRAIEDYKWIESEKAKRDLGLEAQLEWIKKYAKSFREDYEKLKKLQGAKMVYPDLRVKLLYPDSKAPTRAHPTDSGCDVYAHNWKIGFGYENYKEIVLKAVEGQIPGITSGKSAVLNPGDRILIGTGIAATVCPGYEIQVRPKSGVALWSGCTVLNTPGTVDEPYRGELGVILINLSRQAQTIDLGESIAQIVVAPVMLSNVVVVDDLEDTGRGDGGYGSTGRN